MANQSSREKGIRYLSSAGAMPFVQEATDQDSPSGGLGALASQLAVLSIPPNKWL